MNYFIGKFNISDGTKPVRTKIKVPIEWIPIETNGEETLLMSKFVIDWEAYGFKEGQKDVWQDSYLKKVLDDLYEEIFSEEEKKIIVEKKEGKLIVLSEEEICRYMPDSIDRRAQMFWFGKNDEFIEVFFEHYNYWLRNDLITEEGEVKTVNSLGNIELEYAEQDEIGIRPCIYVNTKQARRLMAKAGFNIWHHKWELDEF